MSKGKVDEKISWLESRSWLSKGDYSFLKGEKGVKFRFEWIGHSYHEALSKRPVRKC